MNRRKIVPIGRNLSSDTISPTEMKSLRVAQDMIAKLENARLRKAASIARRVRDGARIEGDERFDLATMTVSKVRAS
jgi:hypothetical protein